MHSRIIQLEDRPDFEPCTEDDLIQEEFVPDTADYVRLLEGSERQDALDWFIGFYGGMALGEEDGKPVLRIRSKEAVMESQFNALKEYIDEFSLENFCSSRWRIMVGGYVRPTGGFQVFTKGYTINADEYFCRFEGTGFTLYIGSVFDYHY